MIKILEESKPFIKRCTKCGCKFQYEYTDLEISVFTPNKIKCPVCGELLNHYVEEDECLSLNDPSAPDYFKTIPYTQYDTTTIPTTIPTSPTIAPYVPYYDKVICKNEVAQ